MKTLTPEEMKRAIDLMDEEGDEQELLNARFGRDTTPSGDSGEYDSESLIARAEKTTDARVRSIMNAAKALRRDI
ncbi:MAG: hypothetical protein WBK28_02310 [Minisyncoccia bacterium]